MYVVLILKSSTSILGHRKFLQHKFLIHISIKKLIVPEIQMYLKMSEESRMISLNLSDKGPRQEITY